MDPSTYCSEENSEKDPIAREVNPPDSTRI